MLCTHAGLLYRQDAVDQFSTLAHAGTVQLPPISTVAHASTPPIDHRRPSYHKTFSSGSQGSPLLIRRQSSSSLTHSQEYVAFPLQNSPSQFQFSSSDHEVELDKISVYSTQVFPHISLEVYQKRLSQEKLKKNVQSMLMTHILYYHIKRWKWTARVGFELDDSLIERLDNDYRHSSECCVQAYMEWCKKRTSPITNSEAIEIFYKAGEFEAINTFIQRLQKRSSK